MIKVIFAFLAMLALGGASFGQTKISGTVKCSKPDEQHTLDVGDRPNHSLMIARDAPSLQRLSLRNP